MRSEALVSSYTVAQYKVLKSKVNEEKVSNHVDRKFNDLKAYEVIGSDLTYVRVGTKWNYICTLIDLHNREIVGYSCGPTKDSNLVFKAFSRIKTNLNHIEYFHTDRGNEFKNKLIDQVLNTFDIKRSLSNKGTPYDNAALKQRSNRSRLNLFIQILLKQYKNCKQNLQPMYGGSITNGYILP